MKNTPVLRIKRLLSKILTIISIQLHGTFLRFRYDSEKYAPKVKLKEKRVDGAKILLNRHSLLSKMQKRY